MTFSFPEKLPENWLKVAEDSRGSIVKTGRDSFKILHDGKNQNVFGNPVLPDWKDITVTEDADFISVDNADGYVFKFRKGTAGYNEIWLDGVQLIAEEQWVLQYFQHNQWRQRGEPQGVEWEQPEPYHVIVRRFYRDFESPETTFYVVWDFYGGFRTKISVEAMIGQENDYRLRWSVSGINKNNFNDDPAKKLVRFWNLNEEATILGYTDVYERFGDITQVDSTEWSSGKKLTLDFNVGVLVVGGFRLDPNFGNEAHNTDKSGMADAIWGSVFTCPAAGTAASITAYIGIGGAGQDSVIVQCAIYKHSDLSLVANGVTSQRTGLGGTGWRIFTFPIDPTLEAIDYLLVAWSDMWGGPTSQEIYYLDGNGPDPGQQGHVQFLNFDQGATPFPDPYVVGSHADRKYSIYCAYDEAPPPGGLENKSANMGAKMVSAGLI